MRKFSVYVFRKVLYLIFLLIFITGIDSLKERALSQDAEFFKVKFYPLLNENISNNNDTLQIKSPIGAAVRSLLIPGLGQIYNGKKAKALLAAAGEGILIYSIYNNNKKFNDTKEVKYRKRRNTLQWWFIFVLGLSAVDAYVDAYLERFDENMNISFGGFNNEYIHLNLCVRF